MSLEKLFEPDHVAVVGASRKEGKTGHEIFKNLETEFKGYLTPVNPKAEEILGIQAEDDIPESTDLIVVSVPNKIVPKVMEDAANKNVEAAIIVSAGFSETGEKNLERQILEKAQEANIDLLGPNVLGLINTENSMNASFAAKMPEKGDISFMSQSGAFCTAILDYSKAEHIGFRHFVSLGNKSMLNEVDFLKKWRKDSTETIISYTEGIENGRKFIKEAEKTSKQKPIVMIKSGRTEKGGNAASSHTGSIAGSYQAYKAAFRKTGIIEAESNRELLDYGRAFSYEKTPKGNNIAIVTNAGGPGVITTDEISQRGLELAEFSKETKEKLKEEMPDESTPHNPLDVIGDADHTRYRKALDAIINDEGVDAVVVVLTPQANTEIKKTAKTIVEVSKETAKPIFASFMGEEDVKKGIEVLENNQVPDFQDPVDAVKTLKAMDEYREFLEKEKTFKDFKLDEDKGAEALEQYSGFTDGMKLFEAYNFDLPLTKLCGNIEEAEKAGVKIGYPCVMKIESEDISHKTDINGVKTDIRNRQQLKTKYNELLNNVEREKPEADIKGVLVQEEIKGLEIAVGMKRDPQFGPLVMVGLGGIYIEALHDISFGIAPISEQEAEDMIKELESSELFEGVRGEENHVELIKNVIIKLGQLALNHEEIKEIDINPLIIKGEKAFVSDIEIVMDG